jgi:hypothetical protein
MRILVRKHHCRLTAPLRNAGENRIKIETRPKTSACEKCGLGDVSELLGIESIDPVYDILFKIAIEEVVVVVMKERRLIVRRHQIFLVRGGRQQ